MRLAGSVSAAFVVVLIASSIFAIAPPAAADRAAFVDRTDDARRSIDIQRVRVNNARRIVAAVSYRNLTRHRSGGLSVYFDTRGPDRGPEYAAVGGLDAAGSDWQAVRVENWHDGRGQPLRRCDIDFRIRYGRDSATFDIDRRCFDRPGRIRVAARADSNRGSQRDWAPKRHRFYDWVRR